MNKLTLEPTEKSNQKVSPRTLTAYISVGRVRTRKKSPVCMWNSVTFEKGQCVEGCREEAGVQRLREGSVEAHEEFGQVAQRSRAARGSFKENRDRNRFVCK